MPLAQILMQQRQQQHQISYNEEDELIAGSRKAESLLPPPIPGVKDNYIILDVEPTSVDTSQKMPDPDPNPAGATRSPISTSPANQTAMPPPPQQQQQSRGLFRRPTILPSFATSSSGTSRAVASSNDGVFANLAAKPERGEKTEDLPPVCILDIPV